MTAGVGLVILALGILAAPLAADAQQPKKIPRIGVLAVTSPAASAHLVEAFEQGLREHGWVKGQNIVVEYRWAEGKFDRLPALAAELVELKVDVIQAGAAPSALAAKRATTTIPIVFAIVPDPIELGLVASLARPGGNATGLTSAAGPEIVGKQLELLREAVPKLTRVAVLSNPENASHAPLLRAAEVAAGALRIQLQQLTVRGREEFDSAFSAMARERVGALLFLPDPVFFLHRAQLAELGVKHRLPSMYPARDSVAAGGLMAYGASVPDLFRRVAKHVDKILKGANPADLPVEQASKFELVINLKTAKTLRLTIPGHLLLRADEIIQ